MDGMFRYAKSIVMSLTIALLALGADYAQSWLFPSVEDPNPTPGVVFLDEFTQASHSLSPMRSLSDGGAPSWKIAMVTNRALAGGKSNDNNDTDDTRRPKSLTEQAQDAVYATPDTILGFANVTLPVTRTRGECRVDSDVADRVVVHSPENSSKQQFYETIGDCTENSKAKDVFVFVHGFNVTMEDAVARAAQIAEDMPFHGVVVAFSWRSVGQGDAYLTDQEQAERFFWTLAELLANLRTQLNADVRLHVLAHSMGNRVTLRALNALVGKVGPTGQPVDPFVAAQVSQNSREQFVDRHERMTGESSTGSYDRFRMTGMHGLHLITTRFPQWGTWNESRLSTPPLASLVLAAPDVDAREFGVLVDNIRHVANSMTLYASDTDYALEASRKVHGGAFRAGDSRARVSIEGLKTVHVSGVSKIDPLGHSYYGSNPVVLTQLARLLRPPVDLTGTVGTVAREHASRTLR